MDKAVLKSLTVEHLRGSTASFKIAFEKGKKLTILYGENGTGKSTICDAFEFFGKGTVGSLHNKGLGKAEQYWCSLGKCPQDIRVILETTMGNCVATVSSKSVLVDNPKLRAQVEVLRRKRISELVESAAAGRYEAIARFIDVVAIEDSEKNLRLTIKESEERSKLAVARVQENISAIERYWENAGKPGPGALHWAEAEATKNQSLADKERSALQSLSQSFNKLRDYPDALAQQVHQRDLATSQIHQARVSVETLKAQASSEYLGVLDLLKSALAYFEREGESGSCPLCGSRENAQGLRDSIRARVGAQEVAPKLQLAESTLSNAETALTMAESRRSMILSNAANDALRFQERATHSDLPAGTSLPNDTIPADPDDWQNWIESNLTVVASWQAAIDIRVEQKRVTSMLSDSLYVLAENSVTKREIEVVLPRLKEVLTIVADQRRTFTDGILNGIASEVGRLYEMVHPGEGLEKITLELDSKKRASLDIVIDFQGKSKAPPQAYYSDSHLDTLGLCVFLALAGKDSCAATVLVLDDVLGSVDEPHVERLIEMLHSEAQKFKHCLITTHYRPWKHKLRWGWLKSGECQFLELSKWSLSDGISLIKSVPEAIRLRSLLEDPIPDLQAICSKAGVILEAILDFLTSLYECHVPRRPYEQYTLGDLLPAIDKKLKSALRVEIKQQDPDGTVRYIGRELGPAIDELTRISQIRNLVGCHFNKLSFDLLEADSLAFGNQVLVLTECLVDEDAGWPRQSKSGSYWSTSGDTRRLHPLRRPS